MELLDRYLQAVKKLLPWKRQDDIVAELRANLESQLEEREAELGRPMDKREAEDWLKTLGHPMVMAARYQPVQYLIGPGIFPMYLYVLRLVFLWATVIYAVASAVVVPLTSQHPESVMEIVLRWPGVLLNAATWVTLVFAALEFVARRFPGTIPELGAVSTDWKPSTLPPVEKEQGAGAKPRSYPAAVAEIVFGFLLLSWLLLIPKNPFLLMGPGVVILRTSPFQLADVWMLFYWCIVGLNMLQVAWKCIDLWRGAWEYPPRAQQIVFKGFSLIACILLIVKSGNVYLTLKNPAADLAQQGTTLETINKCVHLGLMVVTAIAALQLAFDLGKWALDAYRARGRG